MSNEPKPSKFQVWKLAARPHTLTASVVPVIVGYALTVQTIVRRNSTILLEQRSRSCAAAAAAAAALSENNKSDAVCTAQYLDTKDILASASTDILPLAIQFAIFASLIQISTNLHNDYADFVKGADTDKRVGQARATQKGWLTPYETCRGCVLCLLGALFVGMHYLIPTYNNQCLGGTSGTENNSEYDPIMIFIVISSMFNAVAYTGGPFPLGYIGLGNVSIGYSGLGDLFVFLYFGIVATMGVPYLYLTKVACFSPPATMPFEQQSMMMQQNEMLQKLLYPSLLHSIPIGFLGTAIIVVNNLRDRHTDIHAGKRTMAVRFGGTFAKIEYFLLVVGSFGFCVYFWYYSGKEEDDPNAWTYLLPFLSFPMAIPQLKAVAFGGKDGQALNAHVGGTAMLQMAYCVLMTVGLLVIP